MHLFYDALLAGTAWVATTGGPVAHDPGVQQTAGHTASLAAATGGYAGPLILSGDLLLGGALLIACSAYMLRRSRR